MVKTKLNVKPKYSSLRTDRMICQELPWDVQTFQDGLILLFKIMEEFHSTSKAESSEKVR